jgi:NAD(P)H-dependent flavin oxidoreductase YrpB (nitropropane dioxygenase family)
MGVQALWRKIRDNGYIYTGTYTGQYCVSDELYVDSPEPGAPCPTCGRPTETVKEENYFFKLSAFQEKLIQLYTGLVFKGPALIDEIPVLAAGGIADGRGLAAALALGADGVQVGTRFAATVESSAHTAYKQAVVDAGDGGTVFALKKLSPVRMLRTPFALRALQADRDGATREEMAALLGTTRERMGIFEGNIEEGELEAGQSSGLVREILPAGDVVRSMMEQYYAVKSRLP